MDNKDYREDLEYIKSIMDRDGISAPDSLAEDRILAMLPDRTESADPETDALLTDPAAPVKASAASSSSGKPRVKRWLAAAACLVVAVFGGVQAHSVLTAPPDTVTTDGDLYTFTSYKEIENLVNSLDTGYGRGFFDLGGGAVLEESAVEDSAPATGESARVYKSNAMTSSAPEDHSDTYLQVEDVDEADIVKTDGKYIYYVTETREVAILSAENGKTELLSRVGSTDVENYIHDIFLKGDILVTTGSFYEGDEGYTGIVTYDISDRSKPEMIAKFSQTGSIISSRMIGDYVYLVTSDYVFKGGRIVPKCTADGEFKEMAADSICCVPEPQQSSYIVLSAVDITSGKQAKSRTSAIFGASSDIYCNDHNLYAAATEWDKDSSSTYTRIARASLDGLNVRFSGTARVRGYIDNQFSMDEKDGYFRIATTGQRDGLDVNNLFVLDSNLKEVGSVTGFARNESIRAVRYLGDKAYVITYEQIDPLFIIDLSDPARPQIEGEVKIDGFSTLLIPAGEGKLLGIGHATGDNGYGGEYAAGLKLALFDISDPSKPEVIDSMEFENMSSPAQDTHKALTVNSKAGWYAIPYGVYSYEEDVPAEDSAQITEDAAEEPMVDDSFSRGYEGGVLVFTADGKIGVTDRHRLCNEYLYRSVYIGDYIYALDGEGSVYSFRVD